MTQPLVDVRDLRVHFFTPEGVVKAVDGVSFTVERGQTVSLVGESGSGKSMTALSFLRLIDPPGKIVGGEILFKGRELVRLPERELRRIRGGEIGFVFQEPMTALNPVLPVGEQIAEALLAHTLFDRKEAWERAVELLRQVGIPRPEGVVSSYPHELSGGMRQRVGIAIAIANNPDLVIADEPTTALDVTIQAQILDLLRTLREERNMALLLITHDLGVVAEMADYVLVMYAGRIVEAGPVEAIFDDPRHPYTRGLLRAKPVIGRRERRLYAIPGQVPNLLNLPPGCAFFDRCTFRMPHCRTVFPPYVEVGPGHFVACHLEVKEA
ncbi:ABC transporter ATP-binding protein [Brockia lithotrophica]|uniref:Peptide/nickel transport system ATP-binding protein n=1 Tax=Brockia lithotrophica TaxID=933949 RepID=A0A660L713_9BACL|nr:ABC transporter ATP-binding protein [Brockia lithotrophica]RKQ89115.1 peptide/nickel transport system ATP-binding protein [Brockia lithotrophica]